MKTKLASLLVVLFLSATTQLSAQRFTVQPVNDDISYDLDLKAVASIFGDSRNLQDFERRLNDDNNQISNLDLNGDGEVDYLRVIETYENDLHLVVIQAILDRDIFQDVATIVVDRDSNSNISVQVIGDPYLYGYNYIIEPQYIRIPRIFSWFWTPRYSTYISPYRWGYYPRYYRYRRPIEINLYLSHIHNHINYNHRYYYNENFRNDHAYKLRSTISRNDYGVRYPDRDFSNRNHNVKNRYDFEKRSNNATRNNDNRTDRNFDRGNDNSRINSTRSTEHGIRNENSSGERRGIYNRMDDNKRSDDIRTNGTRDIVPGNRSDNHQPTSKPQILNSPSNDNNGRHSRDDNSGNYNRNDNSNSDNSRSINRTENRREIRDSRPTNSENRPSNVSRESNRDQKILEPQRPTRETPRVESKPIEKPKAAESRRESKRENNTSEDTRR